MRFFSYLLVMTLIIGGSTGMQTKAAQASSLQPNNAVPYIVKDVQTGSASSTSSTIATANSLAYFSATDGNTTAIWQTDGTYTHTQPFLTSIAIQGNFDAIHPIGAYDGKVIFNDLNNVWLTDGTLTGTIKVRSSIYGSAVFTIQGRHYFLDAGTTGLWQIDNANDATPVAVGFGTPTRNHKLVGTLLYYDLFNTPGNRFERWRTDGTVTNTVFVSALTPNLSSLGLGTTCFYALCLPLSITTLNGQHYFLASSSAGMGLWVSDGTITGSHLVKLINSSGSFDSYQFSLMQLQAIGNKVFIVADDGVHSAELWVSDGTESGTHLVKDITQFGGASITNLTDLNGQLFFIANDQVYGAEVWTSDGTEAGTHPVILFGFPGGINPQPRALTKFGNQLLFNVDTEPYGRELWISDGTETGTHLVRDINTQPNRSNLQIIATTSTHVYFQASDSMHHNAIWASDVTPANTQLVFDIDESTNQGLGYIGEVNNKAYFVSRRNEGTPGDVMEIWRSDGTPQGTAVVTATKHFSWEAPRLANVVFKDQIYVIIGNSLWRIDPKDQDSLHHVYDFPDSTSELVLHGLFIKDHALWMIDATRDNRLLRLDDTAQSLVPIADNVSSQYKLTTLPSGETLFTKLQDDRLWKTDGSKDNATPIASFGGGTINVIGASSHYAYLEVKKENLSEFWRTDGTLTGTVELITTQNISQNSPAIIYATVFHDSLVFVSADSDFYYQSVPVPIQLWHVSDNTTTPELLLNQSLMLTRPQSYDMRITQKANHDFLFLGLGPNNIWRTDGSLAGTQLVLSNTEANLSMIDFYGDLLSIQQKSNTGNDSLWTSDGGPAMLLIDRVNICDDPQTAFSILLPEAVGAILGETILYCGNTPTQGDALWAVKIPLESNVGIRVPSLSPAPQGNRGTTNITLSSQRALPTTVILTATLPLSVTYITDTLGISPTLSDNTVVWQVPNLRVGQHHFALTLQFPNSAVGTRYPITFTLSTPLTDTTPADNTATTEIWLTAQTFLPMLLK